MRHAARTRLPRPVCAAVLSGVIGRISVPVLYLKDGRNRYFGIGSKFMMAPQLPHGGGQGETERLVLEHLEQDVVEVFYEYYDRAFRDSNPEASLARVRLLTLSPHGNQLTMFPLIIRPEYARFRGRKYERIESISVTGMLFAPPENIGELYEVLEGLPSGFIKDPEFGLGLLKDYRHIIQTIETNESLRHIVIGNFSGSKVQGDTYFLNLESFHAVRKAINRTHTHALDRARLDKSTLCHNALLTNLDPVAYPEKRREYTKDTIFKAVSGGGEVVPNLSKGDTLAVLALISSNKEEFARRHPGQLLELNRDIELITLAQLMSRVEALINKGAKETEWQHLLTDNPFVLSLAFNLPYLLIGGQVAVGGRKLSGGGEKYADFLARNEWTDNLTIVEIKSTRTALLDRQYRGGVYPPSKELSAAVTQALDQRYQLQRSLLHLKDTTRRHDMESYAIGCILLAGMMPSSSEQKKSFELFRSSLMGVTIVTFDELLSKIRILYEFLSQADSQC